LRICHLAKFYPPASGGIETHVRTLAQAQAALGSAIRVICVNHASSEGHDLTWTRFHSTPTREELDGPIRVTRVGRLGSLARLDLCPRLPSVLNELLRDPPDVLHVHTPNPTMVLALAALRPTVPSVITHHSDLVRQRLLRHAFRPFELLVYGRAAVLLATSPAYAEGSALLRRFFAKVEDLPLGLDLTPYLHPSREAQKHACRIRAQHGQPLWLVVGRLVYYKGLHVCLEALTQVAGTLLVIGTGPLDGDLKKRAAELDVSGRVVWKGYASPDELVAAYQAATALWFPSNARSEGFGLVQVEAMASGCPVINTAIPCSGVSWVSRHEESGLTVPVNDPVALAGAARRLLSEVGLRERLGQGARKRAYREFDHMLMASRSLAIYARAMRDVSGTRRARWPSPAVPRFGSGEAYACE
jgi:rhamnosyl/mannosyltransferase